MDPDLTECLYEPAAPDAMLWVGGGKTVYVGSLGAVDWHRHGVAVFVAGMTGNFRLGLPCGDWLSCRAAVIPAGARHALELGGDPLAVLYPEPDVARLPDLARLGQFWEPHGDILVGQQADVKIFRDLYENRDTLADAGDALDDLVDFMRAGAGAPVLDARIVRVLDRLDAAPADLVPVETIAAAVRLSPSRFLHLFSREIGVPFRRFRIWTRLRAAARVALAGRSLTEAALSAGFTDSAHFSRLHRETFGITPSYILRRLARISAAGPAQPATGRATTIRSITAR